MARWASTARCRAACSRSFTDEDGSCPTTSLVQDANGALYGATSNGGEFDYGVIFRVLP